MLVAIIWRTNAFRNTVRNSPRHDSPCRIVCVLAVKEQMKRSYREPRRSARQRTLVQAIGMKKVPDHNTCAAPRRS